MKKIIVFMCVLFVFAACEKTTEDLSGNVSAASSNDQAVTSALATAFTFDKNAQGWKVEGGAVLAYSSTKGNPGGCIRGTNNNADTYWYFSAPAAFLQEIQTQTARGNFTLKFDLKAPSSNSTNEPDVKIVSSNLTLVTNIANDPNNLSYTSYSVPLTIAGNWKIGSLTGVAATNAQIKKALHTIQDLAIRGEFTGALNAGFLDNVAITSL